jgi:hypothetical protein
MNTTEELARKHLAEGTLTPEQKETVESLLKQLEANRQALDAFDIERTQVRERLNRQAASLSEEAGQLKLRLQAILPANPIPPQQIG